MDGPVPVINILTDSRVWGPGGKYKPDPKGVDNSGFALQLAINLALSERGFGAGALVFIPPGIWRIGKSPGIEIGPAIRVKEQATEALSPSGFAIVGSGCYSGPDDPRDWIGADKGLPPSVGPVTVLIWDGEDDGDDTDRRYFPSSLFWVSRAMGLTIADMTLVGCYEKPKEGTERKRARRLILFEQKPGGASNHHTLRNLHLMDASVGVQFGGAVVDSNCADSLLERHLWSFLDTGMLVLHTQGVNYRARLIHARDCGTGFDFRGGGDLNVQGAVFEHCAFSETPDVAASDEWCFRLGQHYDDDAPIEQRYPIGVNNHVFTMQDVRFTGGTRRFLYADLGVQVNALGWHEAQTSQGLRLEDWNRDVANESIRVGRASVVLEGGIFVTKPLIRLANPVDLGFADFVKNSGANIVLRDNLFLDELSGAQFPLNEMRAAGRSIPWIVEDRTLGPEGVLPAQVAMERCDVLGNQAAEDYVFW